MSRLKVSNHTVLSELISAARAFALPDRHRALIVLEAPSDEALGKFAAARQLAFIGTGNGPDRADRITEVLGSEFDILIHETSEDVDAGLLAAMAGTVKAGGVLILGLPFSLDSGQASSTISRFNQRFAHLLAEMLPLFPGKMVWLQRLPDSFGVGREATFVQAHLPRDVLPARSSSSTPPITSLVQQITASQEQTELLTCACEYLKIYSRGCITITGRRGRGKSALLGQIASWLNEQNITFAVTAARQSALSSLHRHSSAHCAFIAPADAHRSGCQVLLVDEASSLPLALLESFLECHQQVIYCSTVEGYENAGRAFALRFSQVLKKRHAHALTLQPRTPWRWNAGDPLEQLIDTLLMSGNDKSDHAPLPSPERSLATRQVHSDRDAGASLSGCYIRLLDRTALALDERLLRQVYGLLRDAHYQTSAADLSHLLDAPDLQLWILEEDGQVNAALLIVLEGGIDPSLHEAIVSKQRRLPHQLLPQLIAQSANESQALAAKYARVIRIAVVESHRRRGLGSQLLLAVECAIMIPRGQASGIGASFASDTVSVAFWQSNGYTRFHTGFRLNPRSGKSAIAVIKCQDPAMESVVQLAVSIHNDNMRCLHDVSPKPDSQLLDTELLRRFANGQRSVHDTFAALSRLALQHQLPLQQNPATSRRKYETTLREAVKAALA